MAPDDRRITALETRFDTLVPLLATKEDLTILEANMTAAAHQRSTRTFEWVMTVCISGIAAFGLAMAVLSFIIL